MTTSPNGVLSNTYQRRISEEEEEKKRIDISENQRKNESECMHVFILLFDEMSPAIITTKNTRKISYELVGRRRKEAAGVGPARRIVASQPIEKR